MYFLLLFLGVNLLFAFGNIIVDLWFGIFQAQVFQLCFNIVKAYPVRQRGINIQGFPMPSFTCLCSGMAVHGKHIVIAVGYFDNNYPAHHHAGSVTSSGSSRPVVKYCMSFLRCAILVSPSTIRATVSPNILSISSRVYSVSSTTSCSRAEAMEIASRPISEATIFATAMG